MTSTLSQREKVPKKKTKEQYQLIYVYTELVQSSTKRWACSAKHYLGRAKQKFLTTKGPPFSGAFYLIRDEGVKKTKIFADVI